MHRLLTDSSLLFLDIISPHAIIIAFSEVIKVAYLTLNLYCIHVMHVKAYSVCTASFSLEDIMNLSRQNLIPMCKYVLYQVYIWSAISSCCMCMKYVGV